MLLLIIFFSPWIESLFTYKPMCLYVEGAPISEYKPACLYGRDYGISSTLHRDLHQVLLVSYTPGRSAPVPGSVYCPAQGKRTMWRQPPVQK